MNPNSRRRDAIRPIALLVSMVLAGACLAADVRDAAGVDSSRADNRVRLSGRSLSDDRGPFLGIGVSYFQALRHAKYDRARLEANLALPAGKGFNSVRALSMGNWGGVEIAPVALTNRAGERGEERPG